MIISRACDVVVKTITFVINIYQNYLSLDKGVLAILAPGGACKYDISCSEYTKQSIARYGVLEGLVLSIKRVWSCR